MFDKIKKYSREILSVCIILSLLLVAFVSYVSYFKGNFILYKDQKLLTTLQMQNADYKNKVKVNKDKICIVNNRIAYLETHDSIDWEEFNGINKCTYETIFPKGYTKPSDLFYVFLKEDRPYMSQSMKEHFLRDGYLATDIATKGRKLDILAPSYMILDEDGTEFDLEREYKVKVVKNLGTTGLTLELHWEEEDIPMKFVVGHTNEIYVQDGDKIKTGDKLALSGGCPWELKFNEQSTGCHIHFEYYVNNKITVYPEYLYSNHGEDLEKYKRYKNKENSNILSELDEKYFRFAEAHKELPYVVSAVHALETGRCANNCPMSLKGARGPLQFMPATWKEYGCDGNGDGKANVENIDDAICGATQYLMSLHTNEKSYNQSLSDEWLWWKAVCRYNMGYNYPCTHQGALSTTVNYSDAIVKEVKRLHAIKP